MGIIIDLLISNLLHPRSPITTCAAMVGTFVPGSAVPATSTFAPVAASARSHQTSITRIAVVLTLFLELQEDTANAAVEGETVIGQADDDEDDEDADAEDDEDSEGEGDRENTAEQDDESDEEDVLEHADDDGDEHDEDILILLQHVQIYLQALASPHKRLPNSRALTINRSRYKPSPLDLLSSRALASGCHNPQALAILEIPRHKQATPQASTIFGHFC
ncbi:hypothetical protein EW146_g8369 [Bondarzewia mesenterica]|uniref:Uncharacterized protein n=1 Tax=Bondarzewia mesenterica TaxID=1095465 RepID=A0A4V3XDN2_9AGAM|nr:hypothetical protein EW146_g8369 [Bondarzewia mesenterica]